MTAVDPFQAIEKIFSVGAALGIVQAAAEDEHLDGGISTVDGRRMVNFGSGGYIGMHPSLTAAGPKRFTGAAHPVLATRTFVLPAIPAPFSAAQPRFPPAKHRQISSLSVSSGRPRPVRGLTTWSSINNYSEARSFDW
jgi:hypothetical protein